MRPPVTRRPERWSDRPRDSERGTALRPETARANQENAL